MLIFLIVFCTFLRFSFGQNNATRNVSQCKPDVGSIYNFVVQKLDGQNISLSKYKGKAVLIVNVATFCEYTQQYKDFNPLMERFKEEGSGAYVVAFPCNQFLLQEPGRNDEIINGLRYVRPGHGYVPHKNVHVYGKLQVNGKDAHPLYNFLKEACPPTMVYMGRRQHFYWDEMKTNDISWNFEKFVINKQGQPVYRIHPDDWHGGSTVEPLLRSVA